MDRNLNEFPFFNRRAFLRYSASFPFLFAVSPYASAERKLPNFVLIVGDDLGYGDLGCYGCSDIETPHVDRLAEEGIRLTDFYASAPEGTPTRCALVTGRYHQRISNMEHDLRSGQRDAGLPPNELTIATILQHYGYKTGLMGKWHLGSQPKFSPNRHGFDEFFGCLGGTIDEYLHTNKQEKPDLYENSSPVTKNGHINDLITDRAIDFVQRHQKSPFFLSVPYVMSYQEMQLYEDCDTSRGIYAREVEKMDQGVGRILDTLTRCDCMENTFVIFCSDNGGGRFSRNEPLTGSKYDLHEGGIRVPCILRWPNRLQKGRVSEQSVIVMDIPVMMLSAAEIKQPRRLDGFDLLSYIAGERQEIERTFIWRNAKRNQKAIRWGKWKWLREEGEDSLYNLDQDMAERHDVKDRFFDIVFLLKDIYRKWESAMKP